MRIVIPFESEKEVTIPVPCFWKEPTEYSPNYFAILDDETVAKVFSTGYYTALQHGRPEDMQRDLIKAQSEWLLIDETEFLRAWDDAFESIRLHPKEVTTANCYSENC